MSSTFKSSTPISSSCPISTLFPVKVLLLSFDKSDSNVPSEICIWHASSAHKSFENALESVIVLELLLDRISEGVSMPAASPLVSKKSKPSTKKSLHVSASCRTFSRSGARSSVAELSSASLQSIIQLLEDSGRIASAASLRGDPESAVSKFAVASGVVAEAALLLDSTVELDLGGGLSFSISLNLRAPAKWTTHAQIR